MNAGDDYEKQRLRELALRAVYTGRTCFSRFLTTPAETDARSAANAAGAHVSFFGGFADAERRMAAFHSEDAPQEDEWPLTPLVIKWNPKYADPGHRDLLGALMGLGVDRAVTGDIAFGRQAGTAYLFCCEDVADYLCANLESAGRARISVERADLPVDIREPEGVFLRVTVQSPRLDAILAAALHLSRGEAARLIEAGFVQRDHRVELRGDQHIAEGELLSVRGHGRLRLTACEDLTRKGRLALRLFKYT